jgi:hypothetical protein
LSENSTNPDSTSEDAAGRATNATAECQVSACGRVLSRNWRRPFLAALRRFGVLAQAAELAGVHRATVARARKRSERFNRAVLDAFEAAADRVEAALIKRAVEHSDRAAIALLDRWRYRVGHATADRPAGDPKVIVHQHESAAGIDSLSHFAAALAAVVEEYHARQAAGQVIENAPPTALPARLEGNKAATEVDGGLCE